MIDRSMPLPGDYFLIPLRDEGYALGRVIYKARGGYFGGFYNEKYQEMAGQVNDTRKNFECILRAKFGSQGFKKTWLIVGESISIKQKEPLILSWIGSDGVAFITEYNENLKVISETKCDPELAKKYPEDGLFGAGALEKRLTSLLSN